MKSSTVLLAFAYAAINHVNAQTFQRLGTCPKLGCVFPPDQAEFYPGQLFDIRLEVHAPVNGTEAFNDGKPDQSFKFEILQGEDENGKGQGVTQFFNIQDSELESWDFSYYEDLFAKQSDQPTLVNVASKAYRALSLQNPGEYTAKLTYYDGQETAAHWTVREPVKPKKKAKNVILFIGDGMTQSMITAARLIGHKSINGKYQSLMQMDTMEALGHQMTHSIDSFITDSANSATALNTGKKSTVNALNVWVDSSEDPFDDPKIETIAELFKRKRKGQVGIVSTAYIADATPAAVCAHTRDRDQYAAIVYEYLNGANEFNGTKIEWPTSCEGADVIFGGGAEQFIPGSGSPDGKDFYKAFEDEGYKVVYDKDELDGLGTEDKALGIFSIGVMAKWLDREVYKDNLKGHEDGPKGDGSDAVNQPGLKDMTLKAIDILESRANADGGGNGWFLMSEAASIDKMMHVLDYDRALGELLELDDTIRATIEHLKEIGAEDDTLIVVTADHGHGFDVYGGADTKFMASQPDDHTKRSAIGVYQNSGLSGYQVSEDQNPNNQSVVFGAQGPNFPVTWDPRYVYAAGTAAFPDHREGFQVNKSGPRLPSVPNDEKEFVVNEADQPDGFSLSGNMGLDQGQGVHSLTDVSVFANGPGHEMFRGVYNSVDIFFKMADAFGLGDDDC